MDKRAQQRDTVNRVLAAREAGHVLRAHAVPHHGTYSIAVHSYHAVSLLLILHPNPTIPLIRTMLWHDGAERWLGDLPSTGKAMEPELKEVYERAEDRMLKRIFGLDRTLSLDFEDECWVRSLDLLECWLWVQDQLAMGNRCVEQWNARCESWFKRMRDNATVPEPVRDFIDNFEWRRLDDL